MHSMAISSGRWGIRCNLVAPGRIKATHECKEADENGTTWEDVHETKDEEDHATNRAGTPQDIAEACWYLADAGFVTAQEIFVDGGASKMK
jgi:NAD(P)-dependent dehydrogenase (short-subunit alcohol dehydrogenase family)